MEKRIIAVVLLILALAFYWYELRPNHIRKQCSDKALAVAVRYIGPSTEPDATKRQIEQTGYMSKIFDECIKEKGIR